MKRKRFQKPRILISACIGLDRCRYDGAMLASEFVNALEPHAELVPICPEVEMGLGVPRDPVSVITKGKSRKLIQITTGTDMSKEMKSFSKAFLRSLADIDGVILKSRSPTCGLRDAKYFPDTAAEKAVAKGAGFFGAAVLERFPELPVEDERRLEREGVREHFLIKVFTLARFRQVRGSGAIGELVRFHEEYFQLFFCYNRNELRTLGRIAANREGLPFRTVVGLYGEHLVRALAKTPKRASAIDVMKDALGYVTHMLTDGEKDRLHAFLDRYQSGEVPLSVVRNALRPWIMTSRREDHAIQRFFHPYPPELEST